MSKEKALYNKRSRSLSYFLNMSHNPHMLLRWSEHFILKIVPHESFLKDELCNDSTLLFPDFAVRVLSVLEKYRETVPSDVPAFFETFRSNKRQYRYYQEGNTKVKGYGMHYYGLAVDLINYKNNRIKWNLNYNKLIEYGNSVGLTNLRPYEDCHFQFIPVDKQNDWREFARYLTLIVQDLVNVQQDGIIGIHTQSQVVVNHDRLIEYFNSQKSLIKS